MDKTIVDEVEGGSGSGREITYTYDDGCLDELTVPVLATLANGAGELNIPAVGTLYTAGDGSRGTGVVLHAAFDPSTAVFPAGTRPNPVAGSLEAVLDIDAGPTLAV